MVSVGGGGWSIMRGLRMRVEGMSDSREAPQDICDAPSAKDFAQQFISLFIW